MLRENRNILEPIILIIYYGSSSERNYAQVSTSQQIFERERTNESKIAYNKQRNVCCVSLSRKTRR